MTTITVTAEHIARGERQSCTRCPIALAIRDAFPGAISFAVGGPMVMLWTGGSEREIDLPAEAFKFVNAFDNGRTVEAFTFELDYPAVTA